MLHLSRKYLAILALACSTASLLPAQTPQAPALPAEVQQHIQHVLSGLLPAVVVKDEPNQTHTLAERMKEMHVPGVSIAVIHNGDIDWVRGFGEATIGGPPVNAETIFQAGSISKPLAAMAALHLVQQRKFSLDVDINSVLKTWKLPDSPAANSKPVTLRELLTHTGGTTVHGFPGYAEGEQVPKLIEVLNGVKPANTPAIRIEAEPGSKWNYSGGGYTIMQEMLVESTHQPFPKFMHDTVLGPLGMTHSTYEQPLPDERKPLAATPYDALGKPIPGGAHTYPEMAAAGLWTMPTDLARYAIEVVNSLHGKSNAVLSQAITREMLTPGMGNWGLGLQIGGSPSKPYFSHGGVNEGFESLFVCYEDGSEGAVVMTNAQRGSALADEVMRSIAVEYNWPDYRPITRTVVPVDASILATYAGTYEMSPQFSLAVSVENGKLAVQATGQPKFQLYAESPTRFFLTQVDAEVEFVSDQGRVTSLILHQGGHDNKAIRK
ncbi:serine hydrolase [Acidicapsa acidisoli]|uniref:serine hydrolase n=1 Tax=Acidicapsa acidisoli TaxID=1615681 RepID=UPI0021E05022|nr:serine hydrolase [Acidicapsa acidisoli]